MRCIECGHELKDGAVFCIRCGAMQVSKGKGSEAAGSSTVKPATSTTRGAAGQHNVKTFKPTPRRSAASIAVPVVGVIAALAAVGALAMFVINPGASGPDSSTSSASAVATSDSSSSSSSSSASSSASSKSSSKSASSKSASASASSASANASNANGGTNGSNTNANNGAAAQQQATTVPQAQPDVQAQPQPQAQATGTDDSYFRGDSSTRYYSAEEVQGMSNEDLFYARNEIYARHGRMFSDPGLQSYFNSKSWYTPIYSPSEFDSMPTPLNDVEQRNVLLMLDVERARGSAYL